MTETFSQPSRKWSTLEERYQVPSYAKWPLTLCRGEGCWVWDQEGNRYLDLYGGHCVSLIGHGHPMWLEAIRRQAAELAFYSNVVSSPVRARYQESLVKFAGEPFSRVFLCNSGAEANETAIKMALEVTGRNRILALDGSFHGRTAAALSATTLGPYREQFPQIVFAVPSVPFGDLPALRGMLRQGDFAALIMEPIQSMAGIRMAPEAYYLGVQELCRNTGTLLIFDEIQTGLGRLGSPFAAHRLGVSPDLITAAKGLGNGLPMAAVLATEEVGSGIEKGELGTTFGGGPLACAAGQAVLDVIRSEELIARSRELEEIARRNLIRGPVLGLRGCGLLLGLETTAAASDVCLFLRQHGILAGTSSDPHVVRLMPPLVLEAEHLELLAEALDSFTGEA